MYKNSIYKCCPIQGWAKIKIANVIVICTQIGKDHSTIQRYGTFRANTHM